MGCWDDGGGWVRVGVRGWAISSSGRTAPRSGNMSLSGRYPEHDICENFNAIDVRELQRKTQMRPGLCFIKEWFRNGARAGEVSIFIHPDAVILVHRARFPGSLNRGLSSCKSLSFGQNATSAAAGLGSNARPLSTVRFVAGALQSFTGRTSPVGDAWGWATKASGRFPKDAQSAGHRRSR